MKIWYFINYWKIVLQDNNISGKYSQEGFNFIKKKKQALIHKPLLSPSLPLSLSFAQRKPTPISSAN